MQAYAGYVLLAVYLPIYLVISFHLKLKTLLFQLFAPRENL